MTSTPQPSLPPFVKIGAYTDPGRVRGENEDSYVVAPMLYAVADGMGGHAAGEVASAMAATILNDRLAGGVTSVDVAIAAVVEANAAIFHGAHSNAAHRGMGTTLTAMTVLHTADGDAPRVVLLNVGDSRGYLYRARQLRRATIDHSYVQELVATGHISEDEARTHPRRNIVTRALGIEPTVRVDSWVLPMVRGDRFVLCSDGLVDEVTDDQIAAVVAANPDPQLAAEQLCATANANGGRDNVTVLVIDVVDGLDAPIDETATFDDAATWAAEPHATSLIDAEATGAGPDAAGAVGAAMAPPSTLASPTLPSLAPSTGQPTGTPTGAAPALPGVVAAATVPAIAKRRFGLGTLLFGLAIASILTITIALVAAAIHNSGNDTPAVTTVLPSTTAVPDTVPSSTPASTPPVTPAATTPAATTPGASQPPPSTTTGP